MKTESERSALYQSLHYNEGLVDARGLLWPSLRNLRLGLPLLPHPRLRPVPRLAIGRSATINTVLISLLFQPVTSIVSLLQSNQCNHIIYPTYRISLICIYRVRSQSNCVRYATLQTKRYNMFQHLNKYWNSINIIRHSHSFYVYTSSSTIH